MASATAGRTPMPTTTRSAASRSPVESVTASGAIAVTVVPRWKRTPCDSWIARTMSPIAAPMTRSMGRASGATTCTSSPRVRSEAATSRPMKLAPTTTQRRAFARARNQRIAVGKGAQHVNMRQRGSGDVKPDGFRAGGQQQRAIGHAADRQPGAPHARPVRSQ